MADASLFALSEEILVAEAALLNTVKVEVLATDSQFVPLPEVAARAARRQVLVQFVEPKEVNAVRVEVLAEDTTFVFPPDIKANAARRQTLVAMPFNRPVNNYVVEVLAETVLEPLPQALVKALSEEVITQEIPTPSVNSYRVEVLGTTNGFEPEINSYVVEVLGDDTSPNSVQRYTVEVLADSTDPVSLTGQTIVWFFNDH